jgi:hypothetical protein
MSTDIFYLSTAFSRKMMEVICSSETSVDFQRTTRRYIICEAKWCVSGFAFCFMTHKLKNFTFITCQNFCADGEIKSPSNAAHINLTQINSRFICFSCIPRASFPMSGERTRLLFNIHMNMGPTSTNRVSQRYRPLQFQQSHLYTRRLNTQVLSYFTHCSNF